MDLIAVAVVDLKAGPVLDWAVAKAIGLERLQENHIQYFIDKSENIRFAGYYGDEYSCKLAAFNPSTDWGQGGPLIDASKITLGRRKASDDTEVWVSAGARDGVAVSVSGKSALETACKFLVAAKFGDAVTVPRELVEVVK